MRILLTGSTGYIGRRLLPVLIEAGHTVICLVRDKRRFDWEDFREQELRAIEVVEADLTQAASLDSVPRTFDVAYYLVHSMSSGHQNFSDLEKTSAQHFVELLNHSEAKQVIYLSGIVNDTTLSTHLQSRKDVESILKTASVPVTVLRAAIIIGSGSASFEIIRDLVEKLPIMIAPRWLNTRCQPIGIRNVIEYLAGVLANPTTYHKTFDIGGTDVLTYREMLLHYAATRNLRRWIITVPVLTPRLSSLWLYFVTSTSYSLARSLVDSMKNEVICGPNTLQPLVPIRILSYHEALQLAFAKIQQHDVVSSWKDSISLNTLNLDFLNQIRVPEFGVYVDKRIVRLTRPPDEVITTLWRIGGNRGWYYGNWMWSIRGLLDKLVGGVGLRRGRRSETDLKPGDALDFWRVLVADKEKGRLLLYAEMKLPGEAWLEFRIIQKEQPELQQIATFRPLGVWGRIYWYLVLPFHGFVFPNMAHRIAHYQEPNNLVAT